jgi:hypothetical protein
MYSFVNNIPYCILGVFVVLFYRNYFGVCGFVEDENSVGYGCLRICGLGGGG